MRAELTVLAAVIAHADAAGEVDWGVSVDSTVNRAPAPVGGVVSKGTLGGVRFEANDIDWAHGSGPSVRG